MARIESFEDLICWKKSRLLIKQIYGITSDKNFAKDFALKDQIRRAELSVMLNIAEGFGRRSHKEFKYFLFLSHGSIAEVQSCLYVPSDLNYISTNSFHELFCKLY